jgi:tRNA(Ile)-lysidine synthase
LREVRRFITELGLGKESGVVAVSGGADSVALLRTLHACCAGKLTVAHVNHRLRGHESEADEAFVRELAAGLGLDCRVKSIDVAALGGNLESTARRMRYEFFAEVANTASARWIATGHTADDQAETVLHRILRGTGIQGLRGIARVLANPDREGVGGLLANPDRQGGGGSEKQPNTQPTPSLTVGVRLTLRPLLTLTRADVLEHLAELKQPFREDSSNTDPRFTRNRIRHELLPLLRTFNPDVVTALVRLAEHAADAHEIMTVKAAEVLVKAERPRVGSTVILDTTSLGSSPAVIRIVLRLVWEREGWPMEQMDADAWDHACEVATREVAAWDFPDSVTMRHVGRVVQIGPRE